MVIGLPLRSLIRLAKRTATPRRSGLMSWRTMVAPRVRRVLMASSTITGPNDIPPAPIRQILGPGPCSSGSCSSVLRLGSGIDPMVPAGPVTESIHAR